MKIISILAIASAAFSLYMTGAVLRAKPRTPSHWLLGATSLVLAYWTFFAYFTYNAKTVEQCRLFFAVSVIGVFLFFPLQNFFVKLLTGKLEWWYILLFAVPALFFAVKNGDGTVTFSDIYWSEAGWMFVPARGSPWYVGWILYAAVAFGTTILYLIVWYNRSTLKREKKQIRPLIFSSSISMALVTLESQFHYQLLTIKTVSLSPILLVPWVAGYVIAIKKYQLLNIAPEMVTRRILEAIDEFVVLVDPEGKPTYMNPKALRFFGRPFHKIEEIKTDQPFLQVEDGGSLLPIIYEEHVVKKRVAFRVSSGPERTEEKEHPVLDMEITKVFDKYDDLLGYLLIGREVSTLEHFQDRFRLTDRELDIVGCIINGWKTAMIAKNLQISERTVKSHISNIYLKCNVTNRVSLLNLVTGGDGG